MAGKIRVGVILGGRSGEHDVSIASAKSVLRAMDREKYEVVPIGITREGKWVASGDPIKALETHDDRATKPAALLGDPSRPGLMKFEETDGAVVLTRLEELDVVFPVLHGTYGEDGTVQGLLELANVPYVGAGVIGSSVGLDKAVFKDVMRARGLPIVDWVLVKLKEWQAEPTRVLDRAETELGYPVFSKPANMGSSVGISKCNNREELIRGLTEAAQYDRKLLVEAGVPLAREIEVGVLGNDDPVASVPGEVIPSREFYSYEAKYFDEGTNASRLLIPAPLSPQLTERVQRMAIAAYTAIDCSGMARADFLMSKETGVLYINELNTIPGFTEISMYPKLWEASGLSFSELIDRLIDLAFERFRDKECIRTSYEVQD